MTRFEFIQRTVAADQRDEGRVERAVLIADALEASGAAPWSDTSYSPVMPTPVPTPVLDPEGGEHTSAVFYRALGRIYVWAKLPELERKAWEEVFATLAGRGVGVADIASREREACARTVEDLAQKVPTQMQLLGFIAANIRGRRVPDL